MQIGQERGRSRHIAANVEAHDRTDWVGLWDLETKPKQGIDTRSDDP